MASNAFRRSTRIAGINTTANVKVASPPSPVDAPTTKRKRATSNSSLTASTESESESDSPSQEKILVKTPRIVRTPAFVILDVERKETTFKGRLGYACINTVLKKQNPPVFCSRTCRIDTIKKNGIEYVKDLARQNIQDLLKLIQWNEDNNIKFMRIASELIPFASHPEYTYPLTPFLPLLSQCGALAQKYGHRLTAHPGQYVQLASRSPKVINASVMELTYHADMLDAMGVGKDGIMIVHGGGMYGDKKSTLERLKETITTVLPKNARERLVLENDEICYSAEDLLPLCEELSIPLVFDYHHDALNPSSIPPSTIITRANAIFAKRGIKPKQHLSEPRPGAVTLKEKRAHSDRCETLPVDLPDDMDLMIEAKDKEQAVLHLHRIYNLHPVKRASLRPPNEVQNKETKGRKSNKRAKLKGAAARKSKAASEDEDEGKR